MLPAIISNWYRVHRRPVATVVFSVSQTIVTIGLSVLFVIILRWHITGVFAALTISSTIFSLVALQQMHGWLNIKYFSIARLKPMLKYAVPFIPAAIAYWLLNSTDSYFLAFFKNMIASDVPYANRLKKHYKLFKWKTGMKLPNDMPFDPTMLCPCGSEAKYKFCCGKKGNTMPIF